jgi:hypothetical protein
MHANTDQVDPSGPKVSYHRVYRGGYNCDISKYCRSAFRDGSLPRSRFCGIGFRIVLELTEEEFLRYAKQYRPD